MVVRTLHFRNVVGCAARIPAHITLLDFTFGATQAPPKMAGFSFCRSAVPIKKRDADRDKWVPDDRPLIGDDTRTLRSLTNHSDIVLGMSCCCPKSYGPVACQDDKQGGNVMINKVLATTIAAALVIGSGASWAQVGVGGNSVAKYGNVEASKNRTVTNHGVGGNAAPSYPKVEASKNRKVTNHGVGGNATPSYAKTGTH
jgi:hypothetical protein